MKYPDTIKLPTVTVSDMYGDRTVSVFTEVPAAFVRRSGMSHEQNADGETSDATVYLLPTHTYVLENIDELEGKYILAEPFSEKNWYKIKSVNVAERKLLNNAIDNIYCRLEKVAGVPYVHNS